jgi:hypothetical protein
LPDQFESDEITDDDVASNGVPPIDPLDMGPYEEYDWPEDFIIRDDSGAVEGPFRGDWFSRDEETGAYAVQTEGRALFFRIEQVVDPFTLLAVDGSGRLWRYHIIAPAPELPPPDES